MKCIVPGRRSEERHERVSIRSDRRRPSSPTPQRLKEPDHIGLLTLPTLLRRGYDKSLSCGAICASGTLGQLIPPSTILILLADILGESVGTLFAAALMPGLLLTGIFCIYMIAVGIIWPEKVPAIPLEERRAMPRKQLWLKALKVGLPPIGLVLAVLGSIIGGIAAPTEAASMGALGSILVAAIAGRFTLKTLVDTVQSTARITAMMFFVLICSQVFALADIGRDDLLNIQYTSGTTGMPKGCMLTHRYWVTSGKVNAFRDGRRYSNILASVPYFYMDPQWLTLMTFFHRGTLFVARRQSSSRFMKWLRDYRINFALFPEIVYKLPPDPADRDNEVIRVNVYGLSPEVHADMEERYDFIVREAYGMTEIGSGMFMPIEATDMVGSGYCGRPSPFREARIVDPSGEVLGNDQEGELQIRGPGIMLGYFNNPEATNASFVDGWFRTGDLARRNPQGYYRLVGRIKDMIRRAGENIAANEVEAVLRSMPEILEAAAVPEKDPLRDEEVKAFIVLRESVDPAAVSPEMVLDFCRQHLARFKVPRYIAFRGPFAKTPSGKIAKHLLLKEEAASPSRVYDANLGNWL